MGNVERETIIKVEGESSDVTQDKPAEKARSAAARMRYRMIGSEIRRNFDQILAEPLPPEFIDFVRKIDSSGGASS